MVKNTHDIISVPDFPLGFEVLRHPFIHHQLHFSHVIGYAIKGFCKSDFFILFQPITQMPQRPLPQHHRPWRATLSTMMKIRTELCYLDIGILYRIFILIQLQYSHRFHWYILDLHSKYFIFCIFLLHGKRLHTTDWLLTIKLVLCILLTVSCKQ